MTNNSSKQFNVDNSFSPISVTDVQRLISKYFNDLHCHVILFKNISNTASTPRKSRCSKLIRSDIKQIYSLFNLQNARFKLISVCFWLIIFISF